MFRPRPPSPQRRYGVLLLCGEAHNPQMARSVRQRYRRPRGRCGRCSAGRPKRLVPVSAQSVAITGARRPDRNAPGASVLAICKRRATPRGGMLRSAGAMIERKQTPGSGGIRPLWPSDQNSVRSFRIAGPRTSPPERQRRAPRQDSHKPRPLARRRLLQHPLEVPPRAGHRRIAIEVIVSHRSPGPTCDPAPIVRTPALYHCLRRLGRRSAGLSYTGGGPVGVTCRSAREVRRADRPPPVA